MNWDKSDAEIQEEYEKLSLEQNKLELELRDIRENMRSLEQLKKIDYTELEDVTINDQIIKKRVIKYSLPFDKDKNRMTEAVRTKYKKSLMKNISSKKKSEM